MTVKPENVQLEYKKEVMFKCHAESDDSTPITYKWERDDKDLFPEPGRIEILEDHTLKLITENDDDEGASFKGKYTCIATNGYSTDKADADLYLPDVPEEPEKKGEFVLSGNRALRHCINKII